QYTTSGGEGGGLAEIVTHSDEGTPSNEGWNCDQELELVQKTGGMELQVGSLDKQIFIRIMEGAP
ncbi:MAG: hypothetical protein ACK2U3_05445, partial [Anaerolineales bacterium]